MAEQRNLVSTAGIPGCRCLGACRSPGRPV